MEEPVDEQGPGATWIGTKEREAKVARGSRAVIAEIVLFKLAVLLFLVMALTEVWAFAVLVTVVFIAFAIGLNGFFINQPNQAKVLTFFGRYAGTIAKDGFWFVNPLTVRKRVSLRIHNFDSDILKVNDAVGNPVEIAAVINWQVMNTAKAIFDVEDYESFVQIQTEAAVRHVASEYPYDDYEEGQLSLRANSDEVTNTLQVELQQRLSVVGVTVLGTSLRRLAYAPEIAQEMLRRQQANAVVAARGRIVEGAVGMVDNALRLLSENEIVELDEERKAAMVSNLLVVLCSDRGAQPVVNSGSLYTG